eukprot:m.180502 g.180502  ORF g.180502 m.180502 type:complete len:500 (+) comp18016_c0_seq5:138-1637(+)
MADNEARVAALASMLHKVGAIKFGEFTLKSGITSPIYFDLRVLIAFPDILAEVSSLLLATARNAGAQFDQICGVPYTALSFGTLMSIEAKVPMVMRRKEVKKYGTKKLIEGLFTKGQTCLIVDDLVTSGLSVFETVEALEGEGLVSEDIIVLLDREQGGRSNIESRGKKLHAVMTVSQVLAALQAAGTVDAATVAKVMEFVQQNQVKVSVDAEGKAVVATGDDEKKQKTKRQRLAGKPSYGERARASQSPIAQRLFALMESKKSNLCVAADVTTSAELLKLANDVGPHICCLKTHCDVVSDWTPAVGVALRELGERHDFLLFEDRKFADIGNTVAAQARDGYHRITAWCDFVNAHSLPGSGVVNGLAQAFQDRGTCKGLLLLAEMSSAGNLCTQEYSQATVAMADAHPETVFGFIAQHKLKDTDLDPFVYMTPGVKLNQGTDALGQQYNTPSSVIVDRQSDVIIVGRGVYKADDPTAAAQAYQTEGWAAYEKRCAGGDV